MSKKILTFLLVLLTPFMIVNAKEKTIAEWEKELNKVQKELDEMGDDE